MGEKGEMGKMGEKINAETFRFRIVLSDSSSFRV